MTRQCEDIWNRRDLIRYFVILNLRGLYRNGASGFLRSLLDPLYLMLGYVIIAVVISRGDGPQFPVLFFSTLLAWRWFTYSLSESLTSVTGRARLIRSIYFPRAILPLNSVLAGLINYLVMLVVLMPLLFIFEARFTVNALWLPLLIFIQFLFTAGAAFVCAALSVYFRDLEKILRFLLKVWFYLSPAACIAAEQLPGRLQWGYTLNPFAALFASFKNTLVLGLPPGEHLPATAALAVVVFFGGLAFFTRKEPQFAKVL